MESTPQAALLSEALEKIGDFFHAHEAWQLARIDDGRIQLHLTDDQYEAIRRAVADKLKPRSSTLTNDELIDLAVEHGLGRTLTPLGLNTGNVFYTDNSYRTAALFDFADAHEHAVLSRIPTEDVLEPVAWRWMPSQVFKFWQYSDDKAKVEEARKFMGDGGVQALYTRPPKQALLAKLHTSASRLTPEKRKAIHEAWLRSSSRDFNALVDEIEAEVLGVAQEPAQAGELPPLPDASFTYERHPGGFHEPERIGAYTADQMRAYARAALSARKPLTDEQPVAIREVNDVGLVPVVLKPFTPAQRRRLWVNSPEHHKDAASITGFERIVTLTERAHGIGREVKA